VASVGSGDKLVLTTATSERGSHLLPACPEAGRSLLDERTRVAKAEHTIAFARASASASSPCYAVGWQANEQPRPSNRKKTSK